MYKISIEEILAGYYYEKLLSSLHVCWILSRRVGRDPKQKYGSFFLKSALKRMDTELERLPESSLIFYIFVVECKLFGYSTIIMKYHRNMEL